MNEIRRSININANPFDLFDKWYEEAKIRENSQKSIFKIRKN